MKKLLILSTGGTISQNKNEFGVTESSNEKDAQAFAEFISKLIHVHKLEIEVHAKTLLNKDSSNINPDDWQLIISSIIENYDEYDVFLIIHGTNTLGYTSAALSFALGKLGKLVLLTGAQVSYGYLGSDAVMNLENALRVIAHKEHDLFGVAVVFATNIITGTRVKKTDEFEYDAFRTFGNKSSLGRIGRILKINEEALAAHLAWYEPRAKDKYELDVKPFFDTNLVSLTEFPGMKAQVLIDLVDAGYKGIIFRASGAGDPNVGNSNDAFQNLRKGFEYLKNKKIPIVVTTQAPNGIASMNVNTPGVLAQELGAIPAWDMSIESMTVKLAWLLARDIPYEEIRSLMIQSFRGEISITRYN